MVVNFVKLSSLRDAQVAGKHYFWGSLRDAQVAGKHYFWGVCEGVSGRD